VIFAKFLQSPHHVTYFTPMMTGFPLEFCNDDVAQKNQIDAPTRISNKFGDTSVHLDTVQPLDRNGKTISRSACIACLHAIKITLYVFAYNLIQSHSWQN